MPRGRGRGGRGGNYERSGRVGDSPNSRPKVQSPTSDRDMSSDEGGTRRRPPVHDDIPPQKRERTDNRDFPNSEHRSSEASDGGHGDRSCTVLGEQLNLEEILREKKFSYRSRLFIASIHDMGMGEFKDLFKPYGECRDAHVIKEKGIGFITLTFRYLAERAIRDLDGKEIRGKKILVRFSESSEALKVSNLSDSVTNELLEEAFSKFGDVAHAVVACDSRGKSLNYGIVHFQNRQSVQRAIKTCSEGCYLLTANPKPVFVKEHVATDEEEGLTEAKIGKFHWVQRERSQPPRLASTGSLEELLAKKWMNLIQSQEHRKAELEQTFKEEKANLEREIEQEKPNFEAELYRQDLLRRKEEHIRMLEQIQQQEEMLKNNSPNVSMDSPSGPGILGTRPLSNPGSSQGGGSQMSSEMGNQMNPPIGNQMSQQMGNQMVGTSVPPLLPRPQGMIPKMPFAPLRPPIPMEPPMHRGLKPPYRGPPRKHY